MQNRADIIEVIGLPGIDGHIDAIVLVYKFSMQIDNS